MEKKINILIGGILALVIVAALGYYLFGNVGGVENQPDYFAFNVSNENLTEERVGMFREQFESAKANIETNEDDFNSWLALGAIKKQIGDLQGAEEIWIHAGEIRPFNSTSFNNLADLYANFTKEYDKAEQAFFRAVENSAGEPQNPGYYRNFHSFYLYNMQDLDKAENILLEGIGLNPNAADLYALMGYFYRDHRNDTQKSIEYLEKNLELNPDNEQVRQDLAELR